MRKRNHWLNSLHGLFVITFLMGAYGDSDETIVEEVPWVPELEVELFSAKRQGEDVKLIFRLSCWPSDWQGLIVGRRIPGADSGQWVYLNVTPVIPRNFKSIRWDKLGLDAKGSEELKKWAMQKVAEEDFLEALLVDEPLEKQAGTEDGHDIMQTNYQRAWGGGDFRYALAYGTGYLDTSADPDIQYEYGLFDARKGIPGSEPLAVCRLQKDQDPKTIAFRLTKKEAVTGESNYIELQWHIDLADSKRFNFHVCSVYRADASDATLDFKHIAYVPGSVFKNQEVLDFFSRDREERTGGDPGKSYVYKIVPVNYFKDELPVSWTVEYRPEQKDARE